MSGGVDWTLPRSERIACQRLTRAGVITGAFEGVTGGSLAENLNTALKVSGALTVEGEASAGEGLVRVTLVTDQDGIETWTVLGTFLAATPSRERSGSGVTTSVELYSTLLIVEDSRLEESLSLPAGTPAVPQARALAEEAGVRTAVTERAAPALLAAPAYFEAGSSRLEAVNHLLGYAGYASAGVDALGTVTMRPYEPPGERAPVWTFSAGDRSVFAEPVVVEEDAFHVPNVVIAVATAPEGVLVSVAVNDDPDSPYSTVARGRRVARRVEYSDIESQAALDGRARAALDGHRVMGSARVTHSYAPFAAGDTVRLDWPRGGMSGLWSAQTREMTLEPGLPTVTTLRRFS